MVLKDGLLSLWHNQDGTICEIESETLAPPAYHEVKTACHIPIILWDLLKSERLGQSEIAAVIDKLGAITISPTIKISKINDIRSIVDNTIQLLKTLDSDHAILDLFQQYRLEIKPKIDSLSKYAVKLQLKQLDFIAKIWQEKYNIDLKKNRVLIVGAHGPRKGLIEMQYFRSWYRSSIEDEPVKNNYVYYIEMLVHKMKEIDIKEDLIEGFLAQEEYNKSVAGWVLDNPLGMEEDVLNSFAPDVLMKLSKREEPGFNLQV